MVDWYLKVVRNYAYFGGRARRAEFWYFTLVNFLIILAIQLPGVLVKAALGPNGAPLALIFSGLGALYSLAMLVPSLAVHARRLHDTGRSAWWFLIVLVPFVGAVVLIVFEVLDSQPGTNKWGPNPKESAMAGQPAYAIDSTSSF